ncbi:MAG: hypothetical protein IT365_07260 [Candidatus Hydrogenedentes bacterium]|nr:hypothetical protein [Candidatus Hydrogenedentota bacterium]
MAVALALTRGRSPNLRYALAFVGLLLIAALLPANFAWLATRDASVSPTATTQAAADPSPALATPEPAFSPSDQSDRSDPSDSSSSAINAPDAGEDAMKDGALATIRAAEQAYQFAHVTARMTVLEPNEGGTLVESGEFIQTDGNIGSRVSLQFDCLVTGRIGMSRYPFQERASVDGRDLRYLEYGQRKTGQFVPSRGEVLPQTRLDKLNFTLLRGGIGMFLPAYSGCGLSAYLELIPPEMPSWRVLESTESNLVIWVPTHDTREEHGQNLHSFVIGLDLTKAGNITRWEEWFDYDGLNHLLLKTLGASDFKQVDGHWFPVSLTVDTVDEDLRTRTRKIQRREIIEYTWSDVNTKPEAEDFRIEFPPKVPVEEYEWGKALYRFVTGNTN